MKIARKSSAKINPRIWLIWASNCSFRPLTSLTFAPGNCFAMRSILGRTSATDAPRSSAMYT